MRIGDGLTFAMVVPLACGLCIWPFVWSCCHLQSDISLSPPPQPWPLPPLLANSESNSGLMLAVHLALESPLDTRIGESRLARNVVLSHAFQVWPSPKAP